LHDFSLAVSIVTSNRPSELQEIDMAACCSPKATLMKTDKRRRLESKGWKFGSAQDFLNLTDEEAQYIELHLSLAALLAKRRKALGYTQTEVADLLGSSQSRVAKMEAGDPSVSVDLLIRTLLALGANRSQLGRAISAASSA
jgi:DNA-binding XRE family transcriptional regulator